MRPEQPLSETVFLQVEDLLRKGRRWLACVRLCCRTKQMRIRDGSACEFASTLVLDSLDTSLGSLMVW